MSMDPVVIKDWIFPMIEAGAAIAAIVLVLLVRSQMKQTDRQLKMTQDQVMMTREQMESSLRPWVGVEKIDTSKTDRIEFKLHNYGSLPTTSSSIRAEATDKEITLESLEASTRVVEGEIGLVFPGQTTTFSVYMNTLLYAKAREGAIPLHAGILYRYTYANGKKGEYCIISTYKHKMNEFEQVREWAK